METRPAKTINSGQTGESKKTLEIEITEGSQYCGGVSTRQCAAARHGWFTGSLLDLSSGKPDTILTCSDDAQPRINRFT